MFCFLVSKEKTAVNTDAGNQLISERLEFPFLTSCFELKIGPQSVSLIRWPISSQPSFAFCTGAIGDGCAVRVVVIAGWVRVTFGSR